MTESSVTSKETPGNHHEFVYTRVFNAPRELVFKVWSEVDHLKKWWGPRGFEWGTAKLDFRPGGVFHYSMRTPDGIEMWGKFEYREIEEPEKIVFVNSFSDAEGNKIRAPFSPAFPLEVLNILTLNFESTAPWKREKGSKSLVEWCLSEQHHPKRGAPLR